VHAAPEHTQQAEMPVHGGQPVMLSC